MLNQWCVIMYESPAPLSYLTHIVRERVTDGTVPSVQSTISPSVLVAVNQAEEQTVVFMLNIPGTASVSPHDSSLQICQFKKHEDSQNQTTQLSHPLGFFIRKHAGGAPSRWWPASFCSKWWMQNSLTPGNLWQCAMCFTIHKLK